MLIGIILIVISPYLAFLPIIASGSLALKNKYTIKLTPYNSSLFLLFVLALLTGAMNKSLLSTLSSLGMLAFWGMGIYLQNNYKTENSVEGLFKLIWKVSFPIGILGIVEKLASYFYDMTWIANYFWSPNYVPKAENFRIYSTFGNPNVAGGWFAFMVLVAIYLIEVNKDNRKKYLASIAVFALAVVATGSKGATLGLLFALLAYAFFTRKKRTKKALLGVFLAIVVLALLSPEVNHELNSRNGLWIQCLEMFRVKPFFGWGMMGILENIGNIHGHNIWITTLVFFGSIGFILYTIMKISTYKSLLMLLRRGHRVAPLLGAVQILILSHGMVDFIIMTPQGGTIFFGACALTAGLALEYEKYAAVNLFGK
ncbi:O-antigen ligase family protein [Alkalibacter mobilis]|uniref:O-antigen ligase family protein n=1 Tax=Alkalibacter mobilis TaxID=2787712 RepID=UPI00189DDB3D|nr:O-antigen ligase family protein [Alkalibacter mobilis]MBF7096413.1 O-antigen ligase family protein [Alkalibacter mobilis]